MRKKKILFVTEASWLSTGYSVYTKEVLSRLGQVNDFEVAELACYCEREDPNIEKSPWKVFANKPPANHPSIESYKKNIVAQFGDQSFNDVLLAYRPDIVMDIRDWWMLEFEQRSPFRDFFHWALMPTVDAAPQNSQWINTYHSADSVFAYSEFGRDTMLSQCKDINFIDVASPAASAVFSPSPNKREHKERFGLSADSKIIGTVMRNQRRKLYPELFESFAELLKRTQDPNLFLYCHTYYPDVGWDIPELIQRYNLENRILFTYRCTKCNSINPDFFQNSVQSCPRCKSLSSQMVGINNSISEEDLANIYNCFDIYVQYSNSEGFGMPQLEAAHCGLPVVSVYYSAMQSVIDNIKGFPVHPLTYYIECETGCKRAVPDNEAFVNLLQKLLSSDLQSHGERIRKSAIEHYNWDKTADIWKKRFDQIELRDLSETWLSPPKIKIPQNYIPENIVTSLDTTNYIFEKVLCKPEWIGGHIWKRTLKDITFGYKCENMDSDFYFNESHTKSQKTNQEFSRNDALKDMYNFRMQINEWEQARINLIEMGRM